MFFASCFAALDASFAAKIAAAAADGHVLRYAASVKPPSAENAAGSLTVGLTAVPASSPLGTLSGSDNLVEIYTGARTTSALPQCHTARPLAFSIHP